jgi:subtilase family serine protease
MKQKSLFLLSVIFLFFAISTPVWAGKIYQNFEPDLGVPVNIWSRTLEGHAAVVDRHDGVHLGRNGAWYESGWNWNGLGINTYPSMVDFKQTNNDRLTFWVLPFPHVTCQIWGCDTEIDNNIGVEIHDNYNYGNGGVTIWTVKKAKYKEWTKLEILFSQLPPDFDLHSISQIQFINYWPGKYYLDDFHAVREDRVYQSFNQETREGTNDGDYGWKWNDSDTVGLSAPGEPVHEGGHSWKMVLNGKWDGGGIQSEQQNYFFNTETNQGEQSFWHNNFLPENNDRLSLWVYALPENGMDNNLNVQIYDHGLHSTDGNKAEFWGKVAARYGQWTRLEIPFNKLPADLNLRDIDKIQIQSYWAGTFYIDDIRATGPHPVIKENQLTQGVVAWDAISGAENYRLQQSTVGPDGPWVTIYSGSPTNFNISDLNRSWLRVRWEEKFADKRSIPYYSPWSDAVEYNPPTVNLKFNSLLNGLLTFNSIPQTALYELQVAASVTGPWSPLYKGPVSSSPLSATAGKWYRVRAIKEYNGSLTDFTSWSRPQLYLTTGTGFVKASGTVLKDRDGSGNELVLSGYNLGNYLLTEDWMTGFGFGDNPAIADEWTIRDILAARFGTAQTENLFRNFENAYLNDFDFDLLARANVTMVRLPIYYRNLMDDNSNFILNTQGQIDFSQLDRVVDAMADRGIYTLLDLHGAPGSQSAESHTGRKGFNKLFEASPAGETYRTRTETLWKEIAEHYKNNTWVLGYDLLNEPVGAPTPTVLADLYDRLYDAIRLIDSNHVIMMEGIWDWDTLPNPSDRNWQNVVYQFHYYCPMIAQPQQPGDPVPVMGQTCADYGSMASRLSYQKAYIDAKVAGSRQTLYQVPAMVGEFSVHDDKDSWNYYVQTFNAKKWSWTVWSYKDRSSPSNWGILNHANYDESWPKFRATQADGTPGDSYDDLLRKISKYTTANYHVTNGTLKNLIKDSGKYPLYQTTKPEIFSVSPREFISPAIVTIKGRNFGATQGTSQVSLNGLVLTPIRWSSTQIEVNFPTGQSAGPRLVTVTTPQGTSNGENVFVVPPKNTTEVSGIQPNPDGTFEISGKGMCDTPGTVEFFPATCIDNPPGSAACNNGNAAITSWSETSIKGYVPPDYSSGSFGGAKIHCQYGGPLYPTMIPSNRAPVIDPIPNRVVVEGQPLSITVTATDPDGDPLIYTVGGFSPGMEFMGQTLTWTPNYSQAGVYTVLFQVDDGSVMSDQFVQITVINSPLPDLTMTNVVTSDQNISPGSQLTLQNFVKNSGLLAAGSFNIAYHLSLDAVYGGADDIGFSNTRAVTVLSAGAQNGAGSVIVVPATTPPGSYYLCAKADNDNSVFEESESNNSKCTTAKINIALQDFIVTSISAPVAAVNGSTMTVNNTIKNQGAGGGSGSFSIGYYLSADATITTSDLRVGSRNVSSLSVGATNSATSTATIPSTLLPGNYYVGAIVDFTNTRQEVNETNNSAAGNIVAITPGADLVVTALSGPGAAVSGGTANLNDTVVNQGVGAISSFTVGYYISKDPVITTADTHVGNRTVTSLAAGVSSNGSIKVNIPTTYGSGTYYWGVIADYANQRAEVNDANNTLGGNTFVVTPGADLVMTAVSGPAIAVRGTTVAINDTVQNLGTGAGGYFYVGFYLSTDNLVTTSDRFLAYRYIPYLGSASLDTAISNVLLPADLAAGTYYWGAIADFDKRNREINETNNSLAGNAIQVKLP